LVDPLLLLSLLLCAHDAGSISADQTVWNNSKNFYCVWNYCTLPAASFLDV
jgi:hypothetical protein